MAKKLHICYGNSCKKEGSSKKIKTWAKGIKAGFKIKKSKCMGLCSKAYAIRFKGNTLSCDSKSELEKILEAKK